MTVIRLAVVTETFLPDINGVATSLQQLLNALPAGRFSVQIIRTRPRQPWQPRFEEIHCPGLSLPFYPDVYPGLPAGRRIRKAWQQQRPDLVYIATEGPLGGSALRQAERMNIPVISAFHTNFHRYSGYYGFGWVRQWVLGWLRRFHNRTAVTLVPAADVATSLQQQGFERVVVLPHGVDSVRFHPGHRRDDLRQRWQAGPDTPVLLFVGRLAAEKNIPLAVRSWQALRAEWPDLQLVLVGDGPLREALTRQYPQLICAGVQTGSALAQHYASADVFVFPSLTETFGLVTLEAMASGLPVAAFDMAAARSFIRPGSSGELAPVADEPAFIDAVRRLLQRRSMAADAVARKTAEAADWASIGQQFEQLCQTLLQQHCTEVDLHQPLWRS